MTDGIDAAPMQLSFTTREDDCIRYGGAFNNVHLKVNDAEAYLVLWNQSELLAGLGTEGDATITVYGESTLLKAWTVEDDEFMFVLHNR